MYGLLGIGTSSSEARAKIGEGRRGDKDVDGLRERVGGILRTLEDGGLLKLADALGFDVEDASAAECLDGANGGVAGAIEIPGELGGLYEGTALAHGEEGVAGNEVVVGSIDLAWARAAGGMRDGEAKRVRKLCKEAAEEGRLANAGAVEDDERGRRDAAGAYGPDRTSGRQKSGPGMLGDGDKECDRV